MNYMIIIDLILAGLLLVTIFYAVLLNKKIHTLKENRIEMGKLLSSLSQEIEKAEEGVNKLQISSSQNEYSLQNQIKKATVLKTDLEHFCIKSDQMLDKLDKKIEELQILESKSYAEPEVTRLHKTPIKPFLNLQTLR